MTAATVDPGLTRADPLERQHRDVLLGRIHFPQSDSPLADPGRAALAHGRDTFEESA